MKNQRQFSLLILAIFAISGNAWSAPHDVSPDKPPQGFKSLGDDNAKDFYCKDITKGMVNLQMTTSRVLKTSEKSGFPGFSTIDLGKSGNVDDARTPEDLGSVGCNIYSYQAKEKPPETSQVYYDPKTNTKKIRKISSNDGNRLESVSIEIPSNTNISFQAVPASDTYHCQLEASVKINDKDYKLTMDCGNQAHETTFKEAKDALVKFTSRSDFFVKQR